MASRHGVTYPPGLTCYPSARSVQKAAVVERDGETFVFVTEDETAHRIVVQLGYENGASVEVRSGINSGDLVVVAGQGALSEGDKVELIEL